VAKGEGLFSRDALHISAFSEGTITLKDVRKGLQCPKKITPGERKRDSILSHKKKKSK